MNTEGVWSPGYQQEGGASDHVTPERDHGSSAAGGGGASEAVTSPAVWTPTNQQPSPSSERKEFRSVNPQLKKPTSNQVCFINLLFRFVIIIIINGYSLTK